MATNNEVAEAWRNDRVANNGRGSFTSSGDKLFSYQLEIGFTLNGKKYLRNYTAKGGFGYKSMTTSHHVSAANGPGVELLHSPETEESVRSPHTV